MADVKPNADSDLLKILDICLKAVDERTNCEYTEVMGKPTAYDGSKRLELALSLLIADRINEVNTQLVYLDEKGASLEEIRAEINGLANRDRGN